MSPEAVLRDLERSDRAARRLEEHSPPWVRRVPTDGRPVVEIAAQIIGLTGWSAP